MDPAFRPIPSSSQAVVPSDSMPSPPSLSPSRPRSFDLSSLAMELPQNDLQSRALRGSLCDHTLQSIQQVAFQNQAPCRSAAPRSLASPSWRSPPSFGDLGNWLPTNQSNYTLTSPSRAVNPTTTISRSEIPDQKPPILEGYAYCIDRGNGQYTRLVPADMLPALTEIPARQPNPNGMVVLPELQKAPPQGVAEMNRPVTVKASPNNPGQKPDNLQRQIDRIVAMVPATPKRVKIYCDKWVHEGICAFAQQGCKYKHEMPFDKATQHSLGLYQGLPAWYKKHQAAKLTQYKDVDDSITTGRRAPLLIANRVGVDNQNQGQVAWRKVNSAAMQQNQRLVSMPPSMDFNKRTEGLNSLSMSATGSLSRNIWGPIEPPQKVDSSSSSPTTSERNSWAPRCSGGLRSE